MSASHKKSSSQPYAPLKNLSYNFQLHFSITHIYHCYISKQFETEMTNRVRLPIKVLTYMPQSVTKLPNDTSSPICSRHTYGYLINYMSCFELLKLFHVLQYFRFLCNTFSGYSYPLIVYVSLLKPLPSKGHHCSNPFPPMLPQSVISIPRFYRHFSSDLWAGLIPFSLLTGFANLPFLPPTKLNFLSLA